MKANTQKTSSQSLRKSSRILAGSIAALVTAGFLAAPEPAQAGTIFWDPNGVTAGFGTGGIWGTDSLLTTDSSGLSAAGVTATTTALDILNLNFTAANTLTMSVAGSVNALSISNVSTGASPIVINNGGSGVIHLYGAGSTSPAITVGSTDRSTTINVPIVLEQGPGSDVVFNGGSGNNSALTLTGAISSTNNVNLIISNAGNTTISTGALNIKGSIVNTGAAGNLNRTTSISSDIGANVTYVTQNGGYSTILQLSGTNTYTGPSIVNSGLLQFSSLTAIGGTGRSVVANFGGGVAFSGMSDPDIATALLTRVSTSSFGAIAVNGSTASNFDFSAAGLTNTSLGATYGGSGNAAVTYTGTYTPYGNAYRLGGSMGALVLSNANALTDAVGPVSQSVTVNGIGSTIASGNTSVSLTNSNDYSGATNVLGGVLELKTNGAITATSGINLGIGGNFLLTNINGTDAAVNRINDAATVTGNGGTFTFANTAVASTAYSETVGALSLASGLTNIVLSTNQNAATNSQTLTFGTSGTGNLAQSVAGNAGTVAFSVNTVSATNNIKVFGGGTQTAGAGGAAGTGDIVGAWATFGTGTNAQTDYAIYTSDVVGARGGAATTEGSWTTSTANYNTATAANTLGGARSMNTLRYNVANGALALGANTFDTNGILNAVAGTLTISGTGALRQQGVATGTIYLTSGVSTANFTITALVNDNTGALSLVKSGGATLLLGNNTNATPVNSTYSGRTSVLGGTLNFNNLIADASGGTVPAVSPLGLSANIDLYPGTTFNYTGAQASTVVNATSRSINLAGVGNGTITLNGSNTNDSNFNWGSIVGTGTGPRTLLTRVQGDRAVFSYGGLSDMSDGSPVSLSVTFGSGSSTSNGTMQLRGASTFSGPILLTGGGNGNTPGTLLIGGGSLAGGGGAYSSNVLNVTSSGTATLTSAGQPSGTYANTITFASGTANQASLYFAGASTNQTLSGLISGPGQVWMNGTGSTLTLSNANTYTGITSVVGGTLILSNNLAIQNSPLATSTGFVDVTAAAAPTFGGLSGSTNLATVISAGYSAVTNLTLNTATTNNVTYSGTIADGAVGMTLTKTGLGIQVLSGNNTSGYTGGTNVNYGTLTYLNTNAVPGTGTTTVAAGATLGLGVSGGSAFTSANVDSLFAGTLANVTNDAASNVGIDTTNGNFTYASSVPATTRGLVKLGGNTLTLSGNNAIGPVTVVTAPAGATASALLLTGNNTITGGITVNPSTTVTLSGNNAITGEITNLGTLRINHAGALGSATLQMGAGVSIANTTTAPIINSTVNAQVWAGNISFSGSALNMGTGGVTLLASTTPTVSIGAAGPLTIGGVITGAFNLDKRSGAGVLELTGVNTYTGTTIMNNSGGGGWIRVSGTGTLGTGAVTINPIAFLDITSSATQNVAKLTNAGGWIQGGTINSTSTAADAIVGQGYITSNLQSTSGGLTANSTLGLFLSGTNTYGGATTVTNYLVPIKPASLPNSGASGSIPVGAAGLLALRTGTGQWNSTAIDNLIANASLTFAAGGAVGIDTATGNFTHASVLPAKANLAITKMGANNLTLTGANLYTGRTTINRGTLTVGDGITGSLNGILGTALTFSGTGTFNVAEATGSTQGMGVLTLSAGDATITSTAVGVSDAATLSFTSAAARTAGATANFTLATNLTSTGGTPNKIVITQFPTGTTTPTGTLIDRGLFFGGSSYATYDTGGFVRGYTTGDANYVANVGGANAIATGATTNVVLTTAAVTGQNTASINTLSITGAFDVDMAAGQALTVNGILKTGGNSATISNAGGTGSIGAAGGELVIRTDAAGDTLNISAPILLGTVTKTGAGVLTLSGTNTFTALRLNQGQININSNTAIPAGATLTINEGTVLDNTSGTNVTLAGSNLNENINGSFTYVGTGGKDLNLNGDNSGSFNFLNDATVTVSAGTLSMKNVGAGSNAAITKSGAGTLVWGGNGTMNLRGPLTVTNGVISCMTANTQDYQSIGTGQVFLGDTTPSNSNSAAIDFVNGNTDLNPITVQAGSSGTIAITSSGDHNFTGPITLNNNLTLSRIVGGGTMSFFGAISGSAGDLNIGNSGSITVSSVSKSLTNVGTVYLRAVNTYTGNTNVNSGTLQLGAVNALPFGIGKGNVTVAATTTLNLNMNSTAINGLSGSGIVDTLAGGTPTFTVGHNDQTSSFGGVIKNTAGTLALTKVGTGTLTLSGINTYTGLTDVQAGTLEITGGAAIANTGVVNVAAVSGAELLVSASETIGSLSGGSGANGEVTLGGNTLTVGDATTTTFGGTISGTATTGTLIKQGAGVLNLAPGAVLTFDTLTATNGTLNVNSPLGTGAGTGVVDVSGATTKLRFGSVSQTLNSLTIGAGSTVIFTSGAASGAFSGGGGGGKAPGLSGGGSAVVPEPGTLGLLLVGALGVLNRRRRQA